MKKIFFDAEARERILKGAEILHRAVKSTMSPLGRNVVIKRPYGHTITHDGVTVAENIEVDDPELAVGADIIKEAAGKLNNEVGDGTTSVTVLTYSLMKEAEQLVRGGMNPMQIRAELSKIKDFLLEKLDERVIDLDEGKLLDVATISAGSRELGELIGNLALEVGKDGTIVVERGSGLKDDVIISDGFTFERSYLSPYFITDKRKQSVVLDNPSILITNKKLKTFDDIQQLIKPDMKSVLIICEELSGDALATVVQSHTRGMLQVAAVQAPSFGDARREMLEDIAAVTGGEVWTETQSGKAGMAEQVVITRESTTIIGGHGDTGERVKTLTDRLEDTEGEFEKEQLKTRIANIVGRVGTIRVGGASESEADEKKYRVDDAVAAVRAAQLGGVVAGGGVTLVNLSDILAHYTEVDPAVRTIVEHSLCVPFVTILTNADVYEGGMVEQVKSMQGIGIDVMKPEQGLVDMIDHGVIDPARVTRQVIDAAFSIAMTAITVDVLVVDLPDEV